MTHEARGRGLTRTALVCIAAAAILGAAACAAILYLVAPQRDSGLPTEVQPVGGGGQLIWQQEVKYQPDSDAPGADGVVYLNPKLIGEIDAFEGSVDGYGFEKIDRAGIVRQMLDGSLVKIVIVRDGSRFKWTVTVGDRTYVVKGCGGPDHKCGSSGVPRWFSGPYVAMEADLPDDGTAELKPVKRLLIRGKD